VEHKEFEGGRERGYEASVEMGGDGKWSYGNMPRR